MRTPVCVLVAWLAACGAALTPASVGAAEPAWTACRKLPAKKRTVKMTLKPDTEVADLIAWISSITCEQFLISGAIDIHAKKVTIVSPQLITREEAHQLFVDALDSVGLTLVRTGRFWRVVETAQARTYAIPFQVEPRP